MGAEYNQQPRKLNWWGLESYYNLCVPQLKSFQKNASSTSTQIGEKVQWEVCSLYCSEENSV